MIDAGSSGSRCHLFRFELRDAQVRALNPIHRGRGEERKSAKKITPGISDLAEQSDDVLEAYVQQLIRFAADNIPVAAHSQTPLFLFGTAGLRILPAATTDRLLRRVRAILRQHSPFVIDADNWVAVIDGDTEGRHMWKTVDTLQRRAGVNASTVGCMDLGGGSTQIAFPHANEIYVHSFLKFGVNEARYRAYAALLAAGDSVASVTDPCLPRGFTIAVDEAHNTRATSSGGLELAGATLHAGGLFVGAGDVHQCAQLVRQLLLLQRDGAACERAPCSMQGVWQPPLPRAGAVFYGRDHFVRVMRVLRLGERPSLAELQRASATLCATPWSEYASAYPDGHAFYCFESQYIYALLHHGYGFERETHSIHFVDVIDNIDTSWTFGAAQAELEKLYTNKS